METIHNEESKKTKKRIKSNTVAVRVTKETAKKINSLLTKLNNKDEGRRIKPNDLIALAVSLVTAEHHNQLTEMSLSNTDRLNKKYIEHCKRHGFVSRNTFLGLIMAGNDALETEKKAHLKSVKTDI